MRLVITECGGFASGPDPRAKHSDIIEKKKLLKTTGVNGFTPGKTRR